MLPLKPLQLRLLRSALLDWYAANRRDLPWRRDPDPYRVWVSEIMLQQTRVAAVLEHYARWMERFPDVRKLAAARQQSVLALWSGLGYYHRARRLHQAAKVIVCERNAEFPRTAEAWRELPGIGRYTAAAIASIACHESVAVVDGNVERVLDRLFGPQDKREGNWQRAEALLDRSRPGDFNQAMMELGATVCTPRAPQCLVCPLVTWCVTRGAEPPKAQAPRKRKTVHYALARKGEAILLVQRPANAKRMAGMWELPELPTASVGEPLTTFRHSITDTDYDVAVALRSSSISRGLDGAYRWCAPKQWQKLPLTGLARKVLRRLVSAT
ncbi:MAG TPA: A/G-specific adenine glycosylase [Candidatus Angelobacter sp.]|nr:A/G-specific adenine glycosylase [Candidatus Angelobacter sp.]